jgi:hypothetical protein
MLSCPVCPGPGQVLITDSSWPLRPRLLAAIREELTRLPARTPYYPGSQHKLDAFKQRHAGHKVWQLWERAL